MHSLTIQIAIRFSYACWPNEVYSFGDFSIQFFVFSISVSCIFVVELWKFLTLWTLTYRYIHALWVLSHVTVVDVNLALHTCFVDVIPCDSNPFLHGSLCCLTPFLSSSFWLLLLVPLVPCQKSLLRSVCWARPPQFLLVVPWFQVLGYDIQSILNSCCLWCSGSSFSYLHIIIHFPNSIWRVYAFPLVWFCFPW